MGRRILVVLLSLAVAAFTSCATPGPGDRPRAVPKPPFDFVAVEAAIEAKINTGSVSLDNVRAVLVSVEGKTRIQHYRHGFTADDTTHVWSVTKSVLSTLVGIALGEGVITSLEADLASLLPEHRGAMSRAVASVTLRQLMTMSTRFADPASDPVTAPYSSRGNVVDDLLKAGLVIEGRSAFELSNASSHLVAAVLSAALRRANPDRPRNILDYARERLFDPLGITTRPAFTKPLLIDNREFGRARFGWATDPQGISLGAFGLRLTPPDLLKIGQLYLYGGVWEGKQLLPRDWIREVMSPGDRRVDYGLLWWLFSWNGHLVLTARGAEGHLIAIVPDQHMVTVISSANNPAYPMAEEDLYPLVTGVIIPALE
ncbi:MAG: serine hydrolase [Micropruina sp.]|nr:serine hydrolase [Micropruina sp.]